MATVGQAICFPVVVKKPRALNGSRTNIYGIFLMLLSAHYYSAAQALLELGVVSMKLATFSIFLFCELFQPLLEAM